MPKQPPTTTVVRGWCVQFEVEPGRWQTSKEHDVAYVGQDGVISARALARGHMANLRRMHRAYGFWPGISRYRIRRATVTLQIED